MKLGLTVLIAISIFSPVAELNAQAITTIAGTPDVFGFSGAGGPATSITMGTPFNVAVDNSGNVFIADMTHNYIWKVNTAGMATIYAGNGTYGYSGDGGPATSAEIQSVYWLSVDNAGNLYFADNVGVVRKINTAGVISTLINEAQANGAASTGDGGPLSGATFINISGVCFDNAQNMYIADYGCGVIRKVNTAGIISTVAGTGVQGFSGDGGPALSAKLSHPYRPAFDNSGNMYIPDLGNNRVRKVDASGIITTVVGNGTIGFSGNGGPATSAEIAGVWQLACDATGNLYIADVENNCVRIVDNAGNINNYAGIGGATGYGYSGDGGPATAAKMTNVYSIALDNGGNLYIADYYNYIIRKVVHCVFATVTQQPANVMICAGSNTSFAITATGATAYQWQANAGSGWTNLSDAGAYAGTSTTQLNITAATAAMNGTQYRCSVTNACGAISTLPALLTVNAPATPTISISTPDNTLCAGSTASFTASITNGGSAPSYNWTVNGLSVATNSNIFSTSTLNNGDVISCSLVSNSSCIATPNAVSNPITMTVNPLVTPVVNINGPGGICAGATASFTASVTNGGNSPSYQWEVNGANAGTNSPVFSSPTFNNGDIVNCILTSNATCEATTTATSNALTMVVSPLLTPTVIIAGPTAPVCAGVVDNFTAQATNGGPSPSYQWLVNGVNAGTNSPVFGSPTFNNGDIVSCMVTSSQACTTSTTAESNTVTLTVNPLVTPTISISTTTPSICVGSTASFSSHIENGGTSPSYQWLLNGNPVGSPGPAYTNSALNNGDVVSCILTSNVLCPTSTTITSNTLTEQVDPLTNASVSIDASSTTICSGALVSFSATPVNGGSSPDFQWQVNGADVGSNQPTYSTNNLTNLDVVSCILTSSLVCSSPTPSQNQVTMTVNPNPTVTLMPDTIIALGQSIVLAASVIGPVTSYQWTPSTYLNNPNIDAPVATPQSVTTYQVLVTTNENCTASGKVTIGVYKTLTMPSSFTPNGDGINDIFRIPPSISVNINGFSVYDRWGRQVFFTKDPSVGWDGTAAGQVSPVGAYVWMIQYQDTITGKTILAKGTVMLIR